MFAPDNATTCMLCSGQKHMPFAVNGYIATDTAVSMKKKMY